MRIVDFLHCQGMSREDAIIMFPGLFLPTECKRGRPEDACSESGSEDACSESGSERASRTSDYDPSCDSDGVGAQSIDDSNASDGVPELLPEDPDGRVEWIIEHLDQHDLIKANRNEIIGWAEDTQFGETLRRRASQMPGLSKLLKELNIQSGIVDGVRNPDTPLSVRGHSSEPGLTA